MLGTRVSFLVICSEVDQIVKDVSENMDVSGLCIHVLPNRVLYQRVQ